MRVVILSVTGRVVGAKTARTTLVTSVSADALAEAARDIELVIFQ